VDKDHFFPDSLLILFAYDSKGAILLGAKVILAKYDFR